MFAGALLVINCLQVDQGVLINTILESFLSHLYKLRYVRVCDVSHLPRSAALSDYFSSLSTERGPAEEKREQERMKKTEEKRANNNIKSKEKATVFINMHSILN